MMSYKVTRTQIGMNRLQQVKDICLQEQKPPLKNGDK